MLIGSDHGVYRYTPADGSVERIDKPVGGLGELTDEQVNALAWDADGTLLVLTRSGGVSSLDLQDHGITFMPLPLQQDSGSPNLVRTMCRTSQGTLWIGTDRGLFVADSQMQHITPYQHDLQNYGITALVQDGNDLWIGTRHNGVRVLNLATGQMVSHVYSPNTPYTIPSNEVNNIYRTRDGHIYVLTTWGLCRYNRSAHAFLSFSHISANTSFVCMQEAANGWLWASSSNRGLFCMRSNVNSFDAFTSSTIGHHTVNVMLSDKRGDLWMATTGGGLYRFNFKRGDFDRFDDPTSVLYNQDINFIEEDDQENLWMGTSVGLVSLGSSRELRDLQVYNFSCDANFYRLQRSSCIQSSGDVFFGAAGGLYRFTPSRLHPVTDLLRVYIHNISFPYVADNQEELKRLGLDVLLYTRKEIELPYADNSFTLHFASARYNGMPVPQFEFMMKGIDNTWAHGTETPEATYANLSPGHYTFLLRSVGQTDENAIARLEITILPPWYRTTLAYLFYVLLVCIALGLAYWYTQMRLKRRYHQQMRRFQAEQEKEAFQSKIRFFIDLVHEIRTPLSLISLPLEQMDEEVKDEPQSKMSRYISSIRRNMNYLLNVTNQLLDFQKAENNGITLVRRDTNVGEMLHDIYGQFEEGAKIKNLQLQLQLPEQPVVVSMDSGKVHKVMMNLVGNALKYASHSITIKMSDDDQLAISVIDDGPGVPAEGREHIFDRYYQIGGDKVAAEVGTGLGLAYAKMLAQAHHGDLTYSDVSGGGSCFTLTLPFVMGEQGDTLSQELPPLSASSEPVGDEETETVRSGSSMYQILLVEDNQELLSATTEGLQRWYKVLRARDGVEALDVVKHHDVDVVVSDVMMPRMDGIQLCQHLKENIDTSHLPIILLTAKTSVEAKLEGMENGADIYMEKPFSIRQLHLQIENLLRLRQHFYEYMRSLDGFSSLTAEDEGGSAIMQLNQQDLQFVERMQNAVKENLRNEEFSIDTLAEQLNMSRSSFYRKIKALTGQTPTDYLKTARMNEAARLLREGCRSSEVCERVGFTSSSYFAKCFRAQFGVLPKDYVAK